MTDDERLPLTRSIEAEVRAAFAVPARADGLGTDALRNALSTIANAPGPIEEALQNAGFKSATANDAPLLNWIDATFEHWLDNYPVAPELAKILETARGLAAAFAVSDTRFFIPGAHVVHRLMDCIHNGMIGWHNNLGGSGQNALEGVRETLRRASEEFPSEQKVEDTLNSFSRKLQAHDEQLKRLDTVLLEREQAALGNEGTELAPASMINHLLREHQVPGSVARFIKSDWYESGKIVAQQYGVDSEEWRSYVSTSELLVEAVQPCSKEPDEQQRLSQAMHALPGTLARQLYSLKPDNEAVAGAVGLIEYALLRNMRGEDLGLLSAEPIHVRGLPESGPPTEDLLQELGIEQGRWYLLETADGETRARLAGTLLDNLYFVFMDFTGARVARKNFTDLRSMLKSGEATPLTERDSFCRSMVEATEHQAKIRAQQQPERAPEPEPQQPNQQPNQHFGQPNQHFEQPQGYQQPNQGQQHPNADYAGQQPYSGQTNPGYGGEHQPYQGQPPQNPAQSEPYQGQYGQPQNPSQHPHYQQPPQHAPADQNPRQDSGQQYGQPHQHPGYSPQDQAPYNQAPQHQPAPDMRMKPPPVHAPAQQSNAHPSAERPYESNTVVNLQLPMGTWLGFHDRDPPLMAKVAVRDLEKDSYIFTNRDGIKLRELTVAQLIALIDRDMVDILERKKNFRDAVGDGRRDQDRLN